MKTLGDWLEDLNWLIDHPITKIGKTEFTFGKLLALVLLAVVAWALVTGLEHGLKRLGRPGRKSVLSESGLYALSRILRYLVWAFAVIYGLDYVGIDVSHLALIGGAIGVGIGFGLQNIFSNFVSGIVLLLEQTLKVGDFVDLQSGLVGRVAEINIRYTRVTTNDSVDVIVPNSEFINGRVTNWTFGERNVRIHVPFGVAYGSDKEKVREAALAAADAVPGTIRDFAHPADVWLTGFGDSSLNFQLVVWVGPQLVMSPGRTQALYLWELHSELARHGIEIPFPQRELHIRSGELPAPRA